MSTDDDADGETTRITRKGQVTIPKVLREEYNLEEGDEIRWEVDEDGIRVRKASQSSGYGSLVEDDVPEEKREEIVEELGEMIREKRETDWHPQ